jgi:hypothetical protein
MRRLGFRLDLVVLAPAGDLYWQKKTAQHPGIEHCVVLALLL